MMRVRAAIALVALLISSVSHARVPLPALLGSHPLHITNHELRTNRTETLTPHIPQKRRLMLSVYRPLTEKCAAPSTLNYMPRAQAYFYDNESPDLKLFHIKNGSHGTFSQVEVQNCDEGTPLSIDDAPLLIFSPALGFTRLMYGAVISAVASSGYTVVSIDHTYDADAIEFPHGELVLGNQNNNPNVDLVKLVEVREADVKSVLDALEQGQINSIEPISNIQAGIFGHSVGGATAATVLANEPRLLGGLNYDGSIFGPRSFFKQGLDKPFLQFGQEFRHYDDGSGDPTWNEFWSILTGWKLEIAVADTRHGCFADLPLVYQVTGRRKELGEKTYISVLSSIHAKKMLDIVRAYTVAFFDFVLKGQDPVLLHRESAAYPKVLFDRKSERSSS